MATGTIKNTAMNWTYWNKATGTNTVQLPTSFNELLLVASSSNAGVYDFIAVKDQLSTTSQSLRNGFYSSSSLSGFCSVNVSTQSAGIGSFNQSGTLATNMELKVYYR